MMSISIPGNAVATTGDDISAPAQGLLRDLHLLPSAADLKTANSANLLAKTPDSVVVIEAGATRVAKAWPLLITAAGAGWTAAAVKFWVRIGDDNAWNQPVALFALGLAFAAAVTSIGYLLGSDIRGRAAATVATVQARERVAVAMIQAAQLSFQKDEEAGASATVALPGVVPVSNTKLSGSDEQGWSAIAVREKNGATEFLLVKGTSADWVGASGVKF